MKTAHTCSESQDYLVATDTVFAFGFTSKTWREIEVDVDLSSCEGQRSSCQEIKAYETTVDIPQPRIGASAFFVPKNSKGEGDCIEEHGMIVTLGGNVQKPSSSENIQEGHNWSLHTVYSGYV